MTDPAVGERPHGLAYRPEIDGLRGLAVLAVMLGHAGFGWMPGGFLGVDLFFVISGYLITAILVADLAHGRFSLRRFYERRIRRILPALLLVMLLCIPPALALMVPDALKSFGQSLVATALFVNNLLLLKTTGYFELPVALKPLMHSWSLGVEEQYYLVVPLLMLLAWRIGRRRALWIGIAAVSALSLAICLWLSGQTAEDAAAANYYLILSRGWELGAGGLTMLAEPRLRALAAPRVQTLLALLGLAMALAPLFLFTPEMRLPGWPALLPVAGIALVLAYGSARPPLTLAPLQQLGLISYSAYLFHQPLFAFARIVSLESPAPWLLGLLIVPVLLLAWLSWRFVEQPFRDRRRVPARGLLAAVGAATLIVIATGTALHLKHGYVRNWPEFGEAPSHNADIAYNMAAGRFASRPFPDQPDGRTRVLVIGDSFARDFINMGVEAHQLDRHAISLAPSGICWAEPPADLLPRLRRADFVVIVRRFVRRDLPCLAPAMAALRRHSSARIAIIGPKYFGWNNNAVMLLDPSVRYAWRASLSADKQALNADLRAALPADAYVDIFALTAADGRVPVFTPDRRFISYDGEHLTRAGAAWLGNLLFTRHPALRALHEGAGGR